MAEINLNLKPTKKGIEKYLFLALLLLFPLGQLQRIPLANFQLGFYGQDIVIFFIVLTWITGTLIKKKKIVLGRFGKYIIAFWLIAFLSFLVNSFGRSFNEIFVASLYLIRWIFYASLYFVLINEKIVSLLNPPAKYGLALRAGCFIVKLLIYTGFTCAVFALLQYFFYPDIRPLTVYQWDPHYYRAVGTFLEPGYLGLILVLSIALLIVNSWSLQLFKQKIFNYFLLGICYLSFILTYSRSAYLSYISLVILLGWFKKSLRFIAIVLLFFVLSILVLPRPGGEGVKLERQSTILSRLVNWQQAIEISRNHPLWGVGFNFYRYASRDYGFLDRQNWQLSHAGAGVDNSFLFVLATTGLVGLASYLLLVGMIVHNSLRKIAQKNHLAIFLTTAVVVIHSFFNNSFFYPWIMIWFWVLLPAMEYS